MNVLLTCLLNRHPDPQSGRTWAADESSLAVIPSATRFGWNVVVIHDCLDLADTENVTYVRVDNDIPNAYWARWGHYAEWLDQHEAGWAWCTDANDVSVLNDPAPHMRSGMLYIGSEPTSGPNARTVGFWWMRHLHPDSAEWIEDHADDRLLNCGIVGGDREMMLAWCGAMSSGWPTADKTDMAFANRVAQTAFPEHVTGEPVHSPMWSFVTEDPAAWLAHK